ncbi:hypothetical protein HHK36_006340 [Tetracentron sinense]|uniref:DUF659 domain-containing protein n=1 Tax=Tetracentron sinense TaxID=13715 RepID=A0A834ZLC8_TETSI|nr:hypothetical protein HHK36_006340 [Tetracentron sinense]
MASRRKLFVIESKSYEIREEVGSRGVYFHVIERGRGFESELSVEDEALWWLMSFTVKCILDPQGSYCFESVLIQTGGAADKSSSPGRGDLKDIKCQETPKVAQVHLAQPQDKEQTYQLNHYGEWSRAVVCILENVRQSGEVCEEGWTKKNIPDFLPLLYRLLQMANKEGSEGPLWEFMENLGKMQGGGGNCNLRCKLCNTCFKGNYYRVKGHLLLIPNRGVRQCSSVDDDMLEKFHKMEDAAQTKKALKEASGGSSANIPLPKFEDFGKKRKGDNSISKSFDVVAWDELDHLIARTFYASGLSFNLIRSPYFRKMIKHACDSQLKGYVVPTYDRLRTTLLQAEKANVELHLKSIRQSWTRKGVSIVSDGWTDSNRKRSLINFMTASENGPVFLKAVDATEEVKSAEYVGKLFLEVISEVGHENAVQLITDNAAVCRAAGLRVEAKHPSIFWTPCIVHTLNLALKNICTPDKDMSERYEQFKWIGQIDEEAKLIRNFVVNHSAAFTIYNKYSKLKLLGVTETRFASTLILVKRIVQVKSALQRMVINESWRFYREEDSQKAQKIKDILVSDLWWDNVEYLLELTEGIGRVPPNLDEEISEGRNACFERLFSSVTMLRKVREEYGKFAAAIGNFGRWEALSERYTINPLAWWGNHGSNAPTLASLAFRVDEHYVEGPSKYWDAVGDEFNLEGPSDLQFANLSLDNPVLESMSFEDDEMSNTNIDLDSITEENTGNQIDGGGIIRAIRWWPKVNVLLEDQLSSTFWLGLRGLPFHLWRRETFASIGKVYGGLMEVPPSMVNRSYLGEARIKIKQAQLAENARVIHVPDRGTSFLVKISVLEDDWFEPPNLVELERHWVKDMKLGLRGSQPAHSHETTHPRVFPSNTSSTTIPSNGSYEGGEHFWEAESGALLGLLQT